MTNEERYQTALQAWRMTESASEMKAQLHEMIAAANAQRRSGHFNYEWLQRRRCAQDSLRAMR